MLAELRRLDDHARWADAVLLAALKASAGTPPDAWREFGHVVGAAETWLARLERRSPRVPVWPETGPAELEALAGRVHDAFGAFLSGLSEPDLASTCAYTNSAGRSFVNPVGEILLHVAMHGQYHRGKVNLLLRQARLAPAPCDYIAFVRGAPAAVGAPAGRS